MKPHRIIAVDLKTILARRRSSGAALLAAACMSTGLVTGAARGDVVGTAGQPPAVGVTIEALIDGQLRYRLNNGRDVTRSLDEVDYLQIGEWSLFNLAEQQQRKGYDRRAAAAYERVLEKLAKERGQEAGAAAGTLDRELLVRCRLLRTYDRLGRFDRAVELYLEIVERMPAGLETLRPKRLPLARSTFIEGALERLDAAIARHGDDPIGRSLEAWRNTWPGVGDHAAQTQPATRPAVPEGVIAARAAIDGIRQAIEEGKPDDALARIAGLQRPASGTVRAELYYWQGRAHRNRSGQLEGDDARRERIREGLSFMRVVIHFPWHPLAPESLFQAGAVCRDLGATEQARRLWIELTQTYPQAQTWTTRARNELAKLPNN